MIKSVHFICCILLASVIVFGSCSSRQEEKLSEAKPKNVILFIGDGMGLAQVYAAMTRNGAPLNLEKFPVTGLVKTYSADSYITDSGAGATAYATGEKTKNGSLGIDSMGNPVPNLTELAHGSGLSTGIVVTCTITHATPAGFAVHVASRDSDELIARQFMNCPVDVVIGGGKRSFDRRRDHLNLVDTLKAKGYSIYSNIDNIETSVAKLYCFTSDTAVLTMQQGRGPMLAKAVAKAIQVLGSNPKGFFLMVEGSQIDWGGHANNMDYLVSELIDMDQAVGKALDFAQKSKNTLVLVTADHETGGLSLTGGSLAARTVNANFSTKDHSAVMVPVYASGPSACNFTGIMQNTDVFRKIKACLNIP